MKKIYLFSLLTLLVTGMFSQTSEDYTRWMIEDKLTRDFYNDMNDRNSIYEDVDIVINRNEKVDYSKYYTKKSVDIAAVEWENDLDKCYKIVSNSYNKQEVDEYLKKLYAERDGLDKEIEVLEKQNEELQISGDRKQNEINFINDYLIGKDDLLEDMRDAWEVWDKTH